MASVSTASQASPLPKGLLPLQVLRTWWDNLRSPPLAAADARFASEELALRLRRSRIGCWLTLLLVPPGSFFLDLQAYPEQWLQFAALRLLCCVVVGIVLWLHDSAFWSRHPEVLSQMWVIAVVAMICVMCALGGGAASPYFAGLLLVLAGVSTLFPWRWEEASVFCVTLFSLWLGACWYAGLDGRLTPLLVNGFFIFGTVAVCVAACHLAWQRRLEDFHLRQQLDARAEELRGSYQRLAEVDRQRSEFFANISHELRTPLTLILAPLTDLLASDTTLPPRTAEALGLARDNGLRLLKLINDLLELVRLDFRRTDLRPERLELGEFLAGLAGSLGYVAEAKGIRLSTAGPPGIVIRADPARLEKVVLNLLTNALKFTPGGGTVALSWAATATGALIRVADDGPGIAAEHLPRIFDRFYQVDGTSTRRHQGVGLGLTLVKELVAEHGGTVAVDSSPGRGTRFTVELPTGNAATATIAPAEAGDALARIHRLAERRGALPVDEVERPAIAVADDAPLVLVVDDEPDMRRYLSGLMAGTYQVVEAADGLAGVETALRRQPDLLLLDLMLPGIDGIEVCRRLRSGPTPVRAKIILLTARMDDESRLKGLAAGADDFLTKPFSSVELRTRTVNLLRSARLERDLRRHAEELSASLRRLQETEASLVQSEKVAALGRMAAGLLHEINNPLNGAMAALQAATHETTGFGREAVDDALFACRRIRDITTDLRVFAYPGRLGGEEQAGLRTVVDLSLRLCAHGLGGIAVENAVDPACQVQGSASQLSHVFVNLFTNAAQALAGVAAPRIRIAAEPRADRRIEVSVADNGPGVPPALRDRIFDPFVTSREPGQGMGLGLSICRTIVGNHGGELRLRDQSTPGAAFVFDLPSSPGSTN